jgi:hypothetical protein
MSRRIAHRPRYHFNRYIPQHPRHSHHEFLRTRWTYRRQAILYQKRIPGQSLLLLPWGFRLVREAIPLIR